jgi:triphosphoribosyl-dephospho-CoA synthetase
MNNENTKDKNKTTWLITGCSSGLGNALAKEVLSAGYTAVITWHFPLMLQTLSKSHLLLRRLRNALGKLMSWSIMQAMASGER